MERDNENLNFKNFSGKKNSIYENIGKFQGNAKKCPYENRAVGVSKALALKKDNKNDLKMNWYYKVIYNFVV